MIRTLIVDDEQGNSEILSAILAEYCPTPSICGQTCNVDEAIQLISVTDPQLVFLDIQMPGSSGFDLLDKIAHKNPEVIF